MTIGARNVPKGTIVDVAKSATTAHVRLDVGGSVVTAAVTNEAVDELKPAADGAACAAVKSSDVTIAVD